MGPIASDAESDKFYFWRNKNFRRGIRRGLGGLNLFRGSPGRIRGGLAELPPRKRLKNVRPNPPLEESEGNSHGGTIPPRTPPGSAWVRAGPRRTPAESAKFNFAAEQKIPPRNPPRTRRTAAEQICSAADPIGSAADWRNFRRRNALKRVRASPPQGYSESVRRGLLKNFVFAELFRD